MVADYISLVTATILPVVAIVNLIILWRLTDRPSWLILIPPKIYAMFYYVAFFCNRLFVGRSDQVFQIWFRIMVVFIFLSTIVFTMSEIIAIKKIDNTIKRIL